MIFSKIPIQSKPPTKSLKPVETIPLPSTRQQMWVSRLLGDVYYKWVSRYTVAMTRQRTLIASWTIVFRIVQNLKPFIGFGDTSIWMNNSRLGEKKNPTNQTKISFWIWIINNFAIPRSVLKRWLVIHQRFRSWHTF